MKAFNPEKELKKIQHGNKNKIIFGIFLLLIILGISSSYALYQVRYSKRIIYTKVAPFSSSDLDLAIYVNGERKTEAPNKDDGYTFVDLICEKDYTGEITWDDENKSLSIVQTQMPIPNKCNVYFTNESVEYELTNKIEEYTIPKDGIYKLEVWGAQGGSTPLHGGCTGGLGGYSTGNIYLEKNTIVYVVVGGAGAGDGTHVYRPGGYNGGGDASSNNDTNSRQSSGGGATHIATRKGLLKDLEDYKEDILIVAGGGGGGAANAALTCSSGGAGGGVQGGDSSLHAYYGISYQGFGGTQTNGGSYKQANEFYCNGTFGAGCSTQYSGSGAGFYGGGCNGFGGGGGSGYLNPQLIHANTQNGIQTGNGKAKITFIG